MIRPGKGGASIAKKYQDAGKRVNINNHIRANTIRLIEDDGEQGGIVSLTDALAKAEAAGLDLVEVAPNSDPPVCRIMDYGKYKYQQSKKAQESKKKSTVIQVKEVKIRPKTEEHDYQFKLRNVIKFLNESNKVKVSLMFRGREIAHARLARGLLERIAKDVADIGTVEQMPKLEGRNMTMMLGPK
jgi:translation initiation factor IF-3